MRVCSWYKIPKTHIKTEKLEEEFIAEIIDKFSAKIIAGVVFVNALDRICSAIPSVVSGGVDGELSKSR